MNRPILIALATLGLAACGQEGGDAPPSTPARPAPTSEQKAALLTALPAPYNAADLDNGQVGIGSEFAVVRHEVVAAGFQCAHIMGRIEQFQSLAGAEAR